jgi:hypothetical protein
MDVGRRRDVDAPARGNGVGLLFAGTLERAFTVFIGSIAHLLRALERLFPLLAGAFEGPFTSLLRSFDIPLALLTCPLELAFAQLGLLISHTVLLTTHLVLHAILLLMHAILLLMHPRLLVAHPVALELRAELRFLLVSPAITVDDLRMNRSGQARGGQCNENSDTIDPDHDILLGVRKPVLPPVRQPKGGKAFGQCGVTTLGGRGSGRLSASWALNR